MKNIDTKKIRERYNLSQRAFAKILNIAPISVRHWEQGKKNMSPSHKLMIEVIFLGKEVKILENKNEF